MTKSEQWQSIITDWQVSGLSQKAFCQERQLKIHTLHYWLRKLSSPSGDNGEFVTFPASQPLSDVSIQIGHAQITLALTEVSGLLAELQQAGLLYDPA